MTVSTPIPSENLLDYVESMLVIQHNAVDTTYTLPLFANGRPSLLFQTTKGFIKQHSNYLTLFGQTTLPEAITFNENFTLVAYFFKPFAITSLFGFSALALTDNPINLTLLNEADAYCLEEKLCCTNTTNNIIEILDSFIFSLIVKKKNDNAIAKYATKVIAENPSKEILRKVQDDLSLSERSFQRMFEDKVGVSPNQYRRIAQFDSAFKQLNQQHFRLLSDIAYENGYADQSHFIRSFKEFTHLTPKEYLKLVPTISE